MSVSVAGAHATFGGGSVGGGSDGGDGGIMGGGLAGASGGAMGTRQKPHALHRQRPQLLAASLGHQSKQSS